MTKKTIVIGFLLIVSLRAFSVTIQSEIMNTNSHPFMASNVGMYARFTAFKLPLYLGIEYAKFNQFGTIHEPIDAKAISNQEQWGIPIGTFFDYSPIPKLIFSAIIGFKTYRAIPINATAIESEKDIAGNQLVTNYKEALQIQPFYKIELSYRFYKQWHATVSKTWGIMKNKITYTYLNTHPVEKIHEYNYDPISMAISYHF
jgi:hypothetical protein